MKYIYVFKIIVNMSFKSHSIRDNTERVVLVFGGGFFLGGGLVLGNIIISLITAS